MAVVDYSDNPHLLLEGLDDQQRIVAEQLRGPVCVMAGAGTGKTRAITHRIAYGVATGTYPPDKVLALTFTNKAAGEMRSRLRGLGVGPVQASTFHSAALRQLGHFWPIFVGGSAPELFESKARPLAEAAKELGLRIDTATLRDAAAEIEWRKVNNLTLADYEKYAQSVEMPGNLAVEDVLSLMEKYEQIKDARHRIDMEDVLLLTAGMLEAEPAAAMQVQERYRFFVVDEFQDVSPLQHHLLGLWMGSHRDVCVVGDASQTIYSFTGARSDYLLDFATAYPEATVIKLERNYRSTEPIVRTANTLMRERRGALNLTSVKGEGHDVKFVAFHDDVTEAQEIAKNIASQIAAGIAPENIAVLYRINAQSAVIEQALTEKGINTHIHGATRFYDLPEIKKAIMALRAASVSVSGEPLFKSVSDVLRSLGWSQQAPEHMGAARSSWEALNALMVMADEAPEGTSFRAFTDELLARAQTQHEPTLHSVTLATVHSAKGLEWDCVYVMGLCEGLFPISYAQSDEEIAEERRLLYVALTRARKQLHLSWSAQGGQHSKTREVSRFAAELGMNIQDGK